jgi:hypothetical protein
VSLTQPSHIIESEEVITEPQLNMATSDTNAVLPEKVMPETPKPEGHNQTVAGFMGAQLSHNDKQQNFNDKQQNFNDN